MNTKTQIEQEVDNIRLEEFIRKFKEINQCLLEQIEINKEKDAQIARMNTDLDDKDKTIAANDDKIKEKDNLIREKDEMIAKQRQEIADLKKKYEDILAMIREEARKNKFERVDKYSTIGNTLKETDNLMNKAQRKHVQK